MTLLAALLAGLLACDTSTGPTAPSAPTATGCDAHADPAVADYCWMREGAAAADADEAAALCERARSYARDCQSQWAAARLTSDLSTAALLAFCGDNPDCAFQVLDGRPDADVLGQIAACEAAGPYADDCVVHALSRWRQARPDAAEVARVADAGLAPLEVGRVVAAVVACQEVGDCGDHPQLSAACASALAEIARTPSICATDPGRAPPGRP